MSNQKQNQCVIDNKIPGVSDVIDNKYSGNVPLFFREYANEKRQQYELSRAFNRGETIGTWWGNLPKSLRCYLLCEVAPDDWERYMSSPFLSIPQGIRAAVTFRARQDAKLLARGWWR